MAKKFGKGMIPLRSRRVLLPFQRAPRQIEIRHLSASHFTFILAGGLFFSERISQFRYGTSSGSADSAPSRLRWFSSLYHKSLPLMGEHHDGPQKCAAGLQKRMSAEVAATACRIASADAACRSYCGRGNRQVST